MKTKTSLKEAPSLTVHRSTSIISRAVSAMAFAILLVLVCLPASAGTRPVGLSTSSARPPAWWADAASVEGGWDPYAVDIGNLRVYSTWTGVLLGFVYPLVDDESAYWHKIVTYASECDMFLGGIRGSDTCIVGVNSFPGDILFEVQPPLKTSSLKAYPFYDPAAIHELEVCQSLCDTSMQWASIDEHTRDTMEALGIMVRSSIIASKKSYLRRSVIVDYSFTNISDSTIRDACIGIVVNAPQAPVDGRAGYNGLIARLWADQHIPQTGSVCGLLRAVPGIIEGVEDTLNIAWMADDDGDAAWTNNKFTYRNPTAVLGVRILTTPENAPLNFNWWREERYGWSDHTWGPRQTRDLFYRLSDDRWPASDREFYHWMTNGEIDYGSSYAAVDMTADGWTPPYHDMAVRLDMADGDTSMNFMLSIGPIEKPLLPGDSINFAYAICMGDDFHYDPSNREKNFRHDNPERYLKGLDFSNLISAAEWAGWYYDNPGVDTDGDGYAGEFYLVDCRDGCDSVYYSGDGVPDYKGPLPPPPPDDFETETFPTKIIARWTGRVPEFARDRHARRPDWEGYKIYVAEHDTARGWSLLASWDREDWVRYSYNDVKETWVKNSHAKTLDQWRRELNDPEFDPRDHHGPSFHTGYRDVAVDTFRAVDGSIVEIRTRDRWSYFVAQDANHANEYRDIDGDYRNRIQLVGTVDTVIDGEVQQYGRYEFEMENLSQAKVLYLAVTSFDYGDYRNYVDPEESAPRERFKRFMAVNDAQVVVDSGLKVTVYPNPYKIRFEENGQIQTYFGQGYEIAHNVKYDERDRRVWFANLPDTAVIEIYSLDGDLIRLIRHPDDFLTRYESVVGWDLISRNTQAVTSGIYIWKVTSRLGSQVGKLVIIK